eukprot:762790-Hanusia_phi.AAC.12
MLPTCLPWHVSVCPSVTRPLLSHHRAQPGHGAGGPRASGREFFNWAGAGSKEVVVKRRAGGGAGWGAERAEEGREVRMHGVETEER